jgi:hypothetical protein
MQALCLTRVGFFWVLLQENGDPMEYLLGLQVSWFNWEGAKVRGGASSVVGAASGVGEDSCVGARLGQTVVMGALILPSAPRPI